MEEVKLLYFAEIQYNFESGTENSTDIGNLATIMEQASGISEGVN